MGGAGDPPGTSVAGPIFAAAGKEKRARRRDEPRQRCGLIGECGLAYGAAATQARTPSLLSGTMAQLLRSRPVAHNICAVRGQHESFDKEVSFAFRFGLHRPWRGGRLGLLDEPVRRHHGDRHAPGWPRHDRNRFLRRLVKRAAGCVRSPIRCSEGSVGNPRTHACRQSLSPRGMARIPKGVLRSATALRPIISRRRRLGECARKWEGPRPRTRPETRQPPSRTATGRDVRSP
jgi:hypothetical protein